MPDAAHWFHAEINEAIGDPSYCVERLPNEKVIVVANNWRLTRLYGRALGEDHVAVAYDGPVMGYRADRVFLQRFAPGTSARKWGENERYIHEAIRCRLKPGCLDNIHWF